MSYAVKEIFLHVARGGSSHRARRRLLPFRWLQMASRSTKSAMSGTSTRSANFVLLMVKPGTPLQRTPRKLFISRHFRRFAITGCRRLRG
jgi:hypothetical protein